ncbi:MAG: acyl dehydratase [Saprospiraceae bacterium]|jgi:acyl dehydratase
MKKIKDIAELKQIKGEAILSDWFEVTQDLVNQFAECTKDYQWIHTDPERAQKESPFGGAIAHGFYSLSLLPMFMEQSVLIESAKMGVNYGLNKVRFPHHVPVGSKLRCHTTINNVEDQASGGVKITWICTIEIEGVVKPACVAEMLSLIFE